MSSSSIAEINMKNTTFGDTVTKEGKEATENERHFSYDGVKGTFIIFFFLCRQTSVVEALAHAFSTYKRIAVSKYEGWKTFRR